MYTCYIPLLRKSHFFPIIFCILAILSVPQEAVVVDGKVINFRTAGVVFFVVIGFPEIVRGCAGFAGGGGYFHRLPSSPDIVGGDLRDRLCRVVRFSVFLD